MSTKVKTSVDDKNHIFTYVNGPGAYEHTLENIHSPEACAGRHCLIHNPSNHHMRDWPLNWRQFDGFISTKPSHFERICPHGVGHPDPDDLLFHIENGNDDVGIHGCDGCCAENEVH